jgi:hypothetical protein
LTLTLPAESLTTLTTLEVDEPAPMSSSGR